MSYPLPILYVRGQWYEQDMRCSIVQSKISIGWKKARWHENQIGNPTLFIMRLYKLQY